MPSRLFKLFSILTGLLPTVIFVISAHYLNKEDAAKYCIPIITCGIAIFALIEFALLSYARNTFEPMNIKFSDAQPANKEMLTFFVASFIPLVTMAIRNEYMFAMSIFAIITLMSVVLLSDSYYVNPILGLLGYKAYQVKSANGITYLLITKKNLNNMEKPKKVIILTSHIYLAI